MTKKKAPSPQPANSPAAKDDTDESGDTASLSRSSFEYVVLALSMAISLMVIFYAVTSTAASDPAMRPYALSLALGLAAILLLFGIIDVSRASKGLLDAAISVLPKIHTWGIRTTRRAILFSVVLLAIAAGSVWIGPNGVVSQTVNCDEAAEIEFSIRSGKLKCEGAFARKVWLTPLERNTPVKLACFDRKSNRWDGTYNESSTSRCGDRPQDASYITNGVELPPHDVGTVRGKRLASSHKRLSDALSVGNLPDRKVKDRLLFATWNIRDFGKHRFGYGDRLDESYAYIAEVISYFDIVAIQEVKDRKALAKLMKLLGEEYKSEFSFEAPGPGGNRERLGFIYDSRKVSFGDISTTIVFEAIKDSGSRTGQPARPPFLAEFIVNGRSFFAVTAHVYFGQTSGPRFERRLLELQQMANGLDKTFERNFPKHPVIFAGDMNVSRPDGREMETLIANGFETTKKLREADTSVGQSSQPYDQILIRSKTAETMPIGRAGVFKPVDHVFRNEDLEEYLIDMKKLISDRLRERKSDEDLFKRFRTYQMSDHHVKWAEFRIDW